MQPSEHMRSGTRDRSLGIATMNGVQRDLIAQRDGPGSHPAMSEVEAYRAASGAGTLERFFVKNLENVQGDERDTILVSTVFGPPASGGRVRQTVRADQRRLRAQAAQRPVHARQAPRPPVHVDDARGHHGRIA